MDFRAEAGENKLKWSTLLQKYKKDGWNQWVTSSVIPSPPSQLSVSSFSDTYIWKLSGTDTASQFKSFNVLH